ncbi:MAG: HEAT repeat domain-containing protein, partial [Candidatus Omnitrophota bacterium]
MLKRTISILIIIGFLSEQAGFAQVAGPMPAPASSGFVYADKFRPVHLRSVDFGRSPGSLNVLLDKGDVKGSKQPAIEQAARDLMTYFFIGVQLPDSSFWVNLRPDSPDRIIDDSLAKTDIGRIMLAADVQLKKDLASCTSPNTKEGREYWNKLYKKAEELFGSEDISIPTVTRPWIVPDEIILRDAGTNAYIYKATLKVLLESDYLKDNSGMQIEDTRFKTLNDYSSQIIRESILPKLSKDVNISKRYAPLRQVYYSLILAQWLKAKFKNAPGTPDMANLTSTTPWSKNTYFNQYRDSFQKGEYNVQETTQTPYGRTIRQYFSGGIKISGLDAMTIKSPLSGPSILAINADPSINPAVYLANSQKARIVMRDGGFETKLLTDDIVAGVAGGDIVMLSEKLKDKFSIFDKGLDWTNTRRWPDMVVYLLKAFMARYPEKLRVMVLGPGSGLELTHIDDIAREQNHQVEIDTMSLTALPRFRLLKSAQEIRHMIVDYLKKDPRNSLSGLVEYYELFLTKPLSDPSSINRGAFIDYILSEDVPVPMSAIPVLQNSGFDVYDVLSGPFINRQFIMSLQDSAIPGAGPGKKYDIILDNRGGFYYTVLNEGLQEAVRVLEPLLDTNGIFYADIVPWMEGETDDITFDNIMIFVKSAHPYSMVIIRKDSVHAAQARALARNADKVSDSVYRVDDMNAFVKAIIPAGPGNEGISRDGGVEDLRSMVKNSKDAIRENIADVLRHFGTNEYTITIKPLIDKLKNRKLLDNVRYDALMSLAGFNDKSVFKALVNELKDDKNSTFIRVNIVRILGQQRDPAAIDVLIEMFQSRDGYIHNAAANELLDVGNPAVPQLIGLMQNESLYRSLSAASLLGKIGDPRA